MKKLTPDQAQAIIDDPEPYRTIAKRFRISPMAVSDIKTGKTWRTLPRDPHARRGPRKGAAHPTAKLTARAVRYILKDTRTPSKIAARWRVSEILIKQIKDRKRWKHIDQDHGHKYDTKLSRPQLSAIKQDPRTPSEVAHEYNIHVHRVYDIREGRGCAVEIRPDWRDPKQREPK